MSQAALQKVETAVIDTWRLRSVLNLMDSTVPDSVDSALMRMAQISLSELTAIREECISGGRDITLEIPAPLMDAVVQIERIKLVLTAISSSGIATSGFIDIDDGYAVNALASGSLARVRVAADRLADITGVNIG